MKKETLEEAAEIFIKKQNFNSLEIDDKIFEAILFGAKWQQERSFTLEQISELFIGESQGYFDDYLNFKLNLNGENPNQLKPSFKEWFEQFKK